MNRFTCLCIALQELSEDDLFRYVQLPDGKFVKVKITCPMHGDKCQ